MQNENLFIKPSEKLAYWIGVAQSDGCFRIKNKRYYIELGVSSKSILMLNKFQIISKELFNKDTKIYKTKKRDEWKYGFSVNDFLENFKNLDIQFTRLFIPPKWCLENFNFFGAYLAGLIDGDGSVCIKRPAYPQCIVKIDSGMQQIELAESIKKLLKCSVSIRNYKSVSKINNRTFNCKWVRLEFLISSKTYKFFKNFVLPYIKIEHKKRIMNSYITSRWLNGVGYNAGHKA